MITVQECDGCEYAKYIKDSISPEGEWFCVLHGYPCEQIKKCEDVMIRSEYENTQK